MQMKSLRWTDAQNASSSFNYVFQGPRCQSYIFQLICKGKKSIAKVADLPFKRKFVTNASHHSRALAQGGGGRKGSIPVPHKQKQSQAKITLLLYNWLGDALKRL